MTKSRSKQNKDALPKQTKKANQRHNMKEKKRHYGSDHKSLKP